MIASSWYLEDLPYCFTKLFEEAHRLPADACDVAGIPYILCAVATTTLLYY